MKSRLFLFALLLAFTTALVAQDNQVNSAGKKIGHWKKYNDKGQLVYEGNFKNDVPVGGAYLDYIRFYEQKNLLARG